MTVIDSQVALLSTETEPEYLLNFPWSQIVLANNINSHL
jgi:hypothetical protein